MVNQSPHLVLNPVTRGGGIGRLSRLQVLEVLDRGIEPCTYCRPDSAVGHDG
ncbi:DUF6233 domain-containing protein [Streptomyces albidoflavus]|uniref:DUF6233 domain-containing protein n=1 Tax=Streptomyces albidoflavus TaxID=1886 RepID=UPI003BF48FDC